MYHTLSDYNDQNKNYINQPYQPTQVKSKCNNLNSMKKGVMVNGSEVFYGKGIKVDPNKSNKANNHINDIKRLNKKIANNKMNKIEYNSKIQYESKEEKEIKITKTVLVNKKIEEFEENLVDLSKPYCFISIRMYNGTIIKSQFNTDKKLSDIYSFVKKMENNKIINFILLDGFPPKPLLEFDKTIKELGIENSMLTQKTDKK